MDNDKRILIAKTLVRFCFRDNTPLEEYHSQGTVIKNPEMKALMQAAVDNVYSFLSIEDEGTLDLMITLFSTPEWDDPKPQVPLSTLYSDVSPYEVIKEMLGVPLDSFS